jgi:uncharacterized protein (DUF885 family)
MSELSTIVDDYIAGTNAWQPAGASGRGFHEHDGRLGDRSQTGIGARMRESRGFLDRIAKVDRSSLADHEPYEIDLLERRIKWGITENDNVRSWQRNPGSYLATIGGGCNGLVIRDFAPLDERLRSLTSRLGDVPRLLTQAKQNLTDPLRPHVETSIEQAAGMRALFLRDLPEAASKSSDEALRRAFETANKTALDAVEDFAAWMKSDLLPKASDAFAWGADTFRKLLSETDSIDEQLDVLTKRGEDDLRAHQQLMRDVAAKIDPAGDPRDVVDAVARDHPAPEQLLPDVVALLEELRQFSIDAGLCTMPTDVRIAVTETPGFSRMTTQAACSTPGPFETRAKEAYYYVTPPDTAWPADRIESYMKFFNRYSIAGVSAHEAYPGHYVHLTFLHRAKSATGKYLLSITPIEGWAHYVEQLMVEAGYADGNPRFHLMQIREALMRLARYRCAFGLHAEGWSVQQAIDFFVNEAFATPVIAERETRRGVIGPSYYAYTMGKHQILRLRDKVKARDGANFNLTSFHDELMQLPFPVAAIEKIMLGA